MIEIKLNKKKDKFEIKCSYQENTLPANMPSRKFHVGRKIWQAPITRLNIEYLNRNRPSFQATNEVLLELNKKDDTFEATGKFPSDYPFKTEPMSHQLDALKKLYPLKNMACFADIGTGKTKIAIDYVCAHQIVGDIDKVLVVALVSLKSNWENEIQIHAPGQCIIHQLDTSTAGKKRYYQFLSEPGFKWLVVGVESFSNGSAYDLCCEFVDDKTCVVLDESSSIKNYNKKRTERCIDLGSRAKLRTILNGTPITQGMQDLYSQFQFLDHNIIGIGDYYAFRNRYVVMGGYKDKLVIGYKNVSELMDVVNPFIYQVRKRDVLKDLPESTYQTVEVEMSKEQKEFYQELKKKLKIEYEGNTLVVKNSINLMQRFQEITGGFISFLNETEPSNDIGSLGKKKPKFKKEFLKSNPKLDEMMAFIERMPDDEQVIVWAVMSMEIEAIKQAISAKYGDSYVIFTGATTPEERTESLKLFQAGKKRFLLGNQSAGGVGLNMTAASTMIYFSSDFSLYRREQSEGRIERIGQFKPMLYVDMMCKGSIDKYIYKAHRDKKDFSELVRAAFDDGSLLDFV